jgi:hypothetical protein
MSWRGSGCFLPSDFHRPSDFCFLLSSRTAVRPPGPLQGIQAGAVAGGSQAENGLTPRSLFFGLRISYCATFAR